jgi:hypothetical protein
MERSFGYDRRVRVFVRWCTGRHRICLYSGLFQGDKRTQVSVDSRYKLCYSGVVEFTDYDALVAGHEALGAICQSNVVRC